LSRTPATRTRLRAEDRRARLLDAAVEVFARSGYAGASMHAIAARAGVVPSVIYDHFASKRDLYLAVMEARGSAAVARTTRRVSGDTPRELLEAVVDAALRQVEEDRFFWRFLLRDPPADAEIARLHEDIQARGAAGLEGLIGAVAPGADPRLDVPRERLDAMLARAAQGAANGLAAWWYEHPEVPREQLVAVTSAFLWDGFGGFLHGAG
jgi:AcrR family transcriptional regulator